MDKKYETKYYIILMSLVNNFNLKKIIDDQKLLFFRSLYPFPVDKQVSGSYQTGDCFGSFSGDVREFFGGRRRPVEGQSNLTRTWPEPVSNLSRTLVEADSKPTRSRLEERCILPKKHDQKTSFLADFPNKNSIFPNKRSKKAPFLFKAKIKPFDAL